MSMLPELLGGEGTPLALTFRGKKYTFHPITFAVMEKLEVVHFEEAKRRLKAMADVYSAEAFERKVDELYQRYADGDFGFLSAAGQKWLRTAAGATALLRLVLGVEDEELIALLGAKGAEVKRLLDLAVSEAMPGGRGEDAPPDSFRHGHDAGSAGAA